MDDLTRVSTVDDLVRALTDRPELAEAAVGDRTDRDGHGWRVAYVVPAQTVSPGQARRSAEAVVLSRYTPAGPPVAVAVVSGIPRTADGLPDEAALAALPVAGTVGAPVRPAPPVATDRRHLAELIDLPSRWAGRQSVSAPVDTGAAAPAPTGPPALAEGPAPVAEPDDPTTLTGALLQVAERWPDRGLRVVEEEGTRLLPYPELLAAARRTLTGLRAAGLGTGDAVILHLPSLLDHCVALWACLIGGIRAVAVAQAPGYTDRNATLDKLEHAWRSLDRPVVLSGDATAPALVDYAGRHGIDGLRVLDVADCRDHPPAAELHHPAPDEVAMLQLSSGSTSRSKVIPLTHRGIVSYARGARQVGRMRAGDEVLNWLPLDHVAGIVMMHIGPVVLGCGTTHVATGLVLADPLRWLDLLHRHRIQHSWAPNFGYKLVSEALRAEPDRSWDLRHVKSLISAGEQCTVPVVRQFLADTRAFGIEPETLVLAWGMAETCTAICYQPADESAVQHVALAADGSRVTLRDTPGPGVTSFLTMGPAAPGARFRITAPDGVTPLPQWHIGRLQVTSDRVTPGYLGNPEANRAAFPDGAWFDTGDLAFLADGRLTITGRGKEIIIVNGVHYFCHDIEDVVGAVDGVAPSFVAAVGAPEADGSEQIVVLFVPEREPDAALLTRIRRHLADRLQVATVRLVPVARERFEKTTSGKIQRSSMRTRLLAGEYEAAERRIDLLEAGPETIPDCLYRPVWTPQVVPETAPAGPVLVVTDRLGLADALGRRLPDVVLLPDVPALRDALAAPGRTPTHVVYAASYLATPDPDDAPAVDAAVEACGTGALVLFRALADAGWTGTLVTVSRGLYRIRGDEAGCYPAALTATLGETFGVEHPDLRTWHLDLPGRDVAADAAVLASATTWTPRTPVVAWRDAPLVRTLHRYEVTAPAPETATTPTTHDDAPMVPPGTRWLVTGGLGGVSRTLLGQLVTDLGLHLLVVGRTPAEQVATAVTELAGGTGRLRYAAVDVADGPALEAAVDAAEGHWLAPLDGVLHLAGDYHQTPVTQLDPRRWRADAAAKVDGSVQVARLLRRRPGSRLVAFSSLLTVVPVVGAGGYAAGNSFLEALGEHLGAERPVQCVSWGMWRGVGMSAARAGVEHATRRHLRTLSPAEGRALTRLALRLPPGHLLAGVDPNAARVRHLVRPVWPVEGVAEGLPDGVDVFGVPVVVVPAEAPTDRPEPPPAAAAPRPPVTAPAAPETAPAPPPPSTPTPPPPSTPTPTPTPPPGRPGPAGPGRDPVTVARTVREVLRQALPAGTEERTAFHDAGLDSVRLLRLHTLLQQALDVRFPQTVLFTHGSPAALVSYLVEMLTGAATATDGPRATRSGPGDGRIAIVGMALRFPGADTVDRYWRNLLAGQVDVRRFSRAELLAAGWPAALVDDPDFVPVSGALDDIAGFDAEAFGITGREASLTDPQQRLFLEVCHEALEDAGYAGTERRVGVFAGSGMHLYSLRSYLLEQLAGTDPADQLTALQVTIGNQPDFLATRVAYRLGLTGPALSVQTACSTSLVAVHLAVRSLLAGESDLALAGAAALHVPGVAGYRHTEGSILSRAGVCRAFDADADGTVGGNGVAAVLLKRLDDALADGDTVHAVILGSAVNNDGAAKSGYTAPTADGHAGVIRDALAAAGVPAESIGYLETHGTGTRVGDPIELTALRTVFADRPTPLPLGAVKPNIGHLDTAAGMAGLIKAALVVRHGAIPPVANLRRPNPELRLTEGPFQLPTVAQAWSGSGPRRAGVSSLGVGGTNAHVVVEEPPAAVAPPPSTAPTVVPLSARTPEALDSLAGQLADRLAAADPPRAEDLLVTLGAGRQHRRHRRVVWAAGPAEAAVVLREPSAETAGPAAGQVTGSVPGGGPGPVVFACTGQGVKLSASAVGLLAHEPAREVLERCAAQYRQTWDVDLLAALRGGPHEWNTATVQPALFALQVAQGRLLESVGIRADVLIGQSAGEYAALCLAGALSLADGLHLAALRGQLIQRGTPPGAALAVLADAAELAPLLRRAPQVELTVSNGPRRNLVAGPPTAVRRFQRQLDDAGLRYRPLPVDRAFHSALLDPVLDDLARYAATLDWQPLRTPLVTGPDGVRLAPGTLLGADHVRRHTRERADFGAGVDGLVADGCRTFVELGPEALLSMLGRQWPETAWIPVQRGRDDRATEVLAALGTLFCRGVDVDWAALAPTGRRVPLPTYPFQRTRHWAAVPRPIPPVPAPTADAPVSAGAPPASVPADEPAAGGPVMSPAVPSPPPVADLVLREVRELTAGQLGTDLDRVPAETPFFDLGADSLLMINLLRDVESAFGIRVSMRELFEELDSPQLLTGAIVDRAAPDRLAALAGTAAPAPDPAAPAPDPAAPAPDPAAAAPDPAAATDPVAAGASQPAPAPAVAPSAAAAPTVPPTAYAPGALAAPGPGSGVGQVPGVSAAPVVPVAQPAALPFPAGAAPVGDPATTELLRGQLALMGQFTDLMARQLSTLAAVAPPAVPPAGAVLPAPGTALPPTGTGAPAPAGPDAPAPAVAGVPAPAQSAGSSALTPAPPGEPAQLGPRPTRVGAGLGGGRLDSRQQAHFADLVRRYTERTPTSKALAQRHRRRLADSRAVVGFRRATKELLYPLAARRARGAYLEDVDGNSYVDITMGFGALLFGHEPEFLRRAVAAQLDDGGLRLGPRGAETGEAAELLCELTGMDRAAFATTGTEANSAAFRLARAYTGRPVIVTFTGAYHGHIDPVLGRGVRDGGTWRTVPVSAGIPDSAVADVLVLPYDDPRSLDVIERDAHRIAAVVVEPVQSRHPDRQPAEFLRALRAACDRHGMVLLFDEMLTGFRPHPQGAQGVFGVRADLATYGKVIGGGYPVGAIAGRAEIMDWVDGGFWTYGDDSAPPQDTTFFGGTYIQHPLSMVAARAVLTELRDRGPALQEGLNRRTERLASAVNAFCAEQEFPLRVHRFGSLFRFASQVNLDLLFHHLVLAGVHVWEWRNFFLSDAHTDADVDRIVDAVRRSLLELRAGGFLPGGPGTSTAPPKATPTVAPVAPTAGPAPVAVANRTVAEVDLSLYFFGDYPQERVQDRYDAVLDAATFADTHGLHAVWLPERHFDSFGGIFPNPSVLAAAVAARTSRVRIHAGCAVLPLHDPIRVAEEWSVVDNLSKGRVGIGCASGWHARDFVLAPQTYGRHREAMYESVEQIRRLWRGEPVTRTAGNGEPVEIRLFPPPVQPMPPLFTAVVGNPESYRKAAAADLGIITNLMSQDIRQLADNIARYRATRAEHGLDPAQGRIVLLLHTYLGADGDRAREEAFGPFCDYLRSSLALFGQVTNSLGVTIDLESTSPEDVDYLLRRAYDRYTTDRALIGSPDEARALVERFVALGVDEVGCFVDFGLSPDRMLAGLPGVDRLGTLLRGSAPTTAGPQNAAPVVVGPQPAGPQNAVPVSAVPVDAVPVDAVPVGGFPLTEAQREIWFADRVLPGRPTYTESQVVRLDGPLDTAALRTALTLVTGRHPALRSTFHEVDGEPRQVVHPPTPVELPVHDATGRDVATLAAQLADEETAHRFDLATGPLFAPRLVRVRDDRYLLVLRMHHLVIDTLSAQILGREVAAGYRAAIAGVPVALPAPPPWPVPADDTAPEVLDAQLAYWRDRLGPRPPRLDLPTDRPRPAVPSGVGAVATAVLDAALTRAVRDCGRRHRATPFMVLVAGFAVVLAEAAGESDVLLGTPVAHRPAGAQEAVGLFITTLPLRLSVTAGESFAAVLRSARTALLDAHDNGDVPVQRVARALGVEPAPGRHPLFDVVIEYDNRPAFEFDLPDVRATLLDAAVRRAPFDLTLFLTDLGETVRCQLNYATDLFDPGTAERILDRLATVLRAVTQQPDEPLSVLPRPAAVPAPAVAEPPAAWSDGGPPADGAGAPLPALLAVDRATVVDPDGRLTGPELRDRADAVTAALRDAGIGRGDLVGVHLPRSADAVAAMLGVLHAGAAYVPLAPDQPAARLADIAAQGGIRVVVSRSALPPLAGVGLTVHLDRLAVGPDPTGGPTPVGLDEPAYVLFTSGSTGRPKGCVIPHRAISNTVAWYTRDLGITAVDRLSWFCSPGFDASCIEVWPALRAGASLHVVPDSARVDPVRLRDWLVAQGITVAMFPTPVGELLLDLDWSAGPRPALRHLVVGGDRLRRGPSASLPFPVTNVYGPTEATVVSTWVHLAPGADDGLPPIGRPVPGTWVRVLDDDGRPVPVGVPGEAYLGGEQVGHGYLGLPGETERRFLRHPGYGPVFRTGDVVRWRPDGQLEFLRRSDAQVQIRGFRVEPGEAEHQLRRLAGVRDAAVRSWTDADGGHYLAGYVVPDHDGVEPTELARELTAHLPDYLVPTAWTLLPELPSTETGKIDRAALPEPDRKAVEWAGTGTPPANDLEHRLHDLWCAELGLPTLGVESTFFALGGTSLTALRLLNRVRAETGGTIEVLDFLRAPTVRAMAQRLSGSWAPSTAQVTGEATAAPTGRGAWPADAASAAGGVRPAGDDWQVLATAPTSIGQARQYQITTETAFPQVLTVALRLTLRGPLDPVALRRALTDLTVRHAVLRTRYARHDGTVRQEVLAPRPVPLPVRAVPADQLDEAVQEWASIPFDLHREPSFRAVLFAPQPVPADPEASGHELGLAIHHGFVDGWSTQPLMADLAEFYRAAVTGEPADLPPLPADFVDFCRWEEDYLARPETHRMLRDWADSLPAGTVPTVLPADRPRQPGATDPGGVLRHRFPPELVAQVTAYGVGRDATPYVVLAAAFAWLLHGLTGAPTVTLTSSVANRTDPRYDRVVGVFAQAAWLIIPVAGAESFDELVGRTARATWQALARQAVPGVVQNAALGGAFAGFPPRIYFDLLDLADPVLHLTGLDPAPARDVLLAGSRGDLTWALRPDDEGGMTLLVEYAALLFDRATVTGWLDRYQRLLPRLLAAPDVPLPRPLDDGPA